MARLSLDPNLAFESPPPAIDFLESQFFRKHAQGLLPSLPEPDRLGDTGSDGSTGSVAIAELGLFVKYGQDHRVNFEELRTMQTVRRTFPHDKVPVPEPVAWRRIGISNFIYMSFIEGSVLVDCWSNLTEHERTTMSQQLKNAVALLRSVRQDPAQPCIGSVYGGLVQDAFFRSDRHAGPFASVKEFNDRLLLWSMPWRSASEIQQDPFRQLLWDEAGIRFTHADLHFDNILISGEPGSRSIVAILDWGMSGWYPEYWEYCKTFFGIGDLDRDPYEWLQQVMDPYDTEYDGFAYYWQCRGTP